MEAVHVVLIVLNRDVVFDEQFILKQSIEIEVSESAGDNPGREVIR
jgi:hypothetical protein